MATQVEISPPLTGPLESTNPSLRQGLHRRQSSRHSHQDVSRQKPWQGRLRASSFRSNRSKPPPPEPEEVERLSRQMSARSTRSSKHQRRPRWWKIRLFRGMIDDVKRRFPYYWSDWRDAWDYRVVPATVYMYFAKYGKNSVFNFSFKIHLRFLRI